MKAQCVWGRWGGGGDKKFGTLFWKSKFMGIIKPYLTADAFMWHNPQTRKRTCIIINVTCRLRWKVDNCIRASTRNNSEYCEIQLECQHTGTLALYAGGTVFYSLLQTYFQSNLYKDKEVQLPPLSVFYFIYGLFNDTVSSSDYIALNDFPEDGRKSSFFINSNILQALYQIYHFTRMKQSMLFHHQLVNMHYI
jgi:hypothetical protein